MMCSKFDLFGVELGEPTRINKGNRHVVTRASTSKFTSRIINFLLRPKHRGHQLETSSSTSGPRKEEKNLEDISTRPSHATISNNMDILKFGTNKIYEYFRIDEELIPSIASIVKEMSGVHCT